MKDAFDKDVRTYNAEVNDVWVHDRSAKTVWPSVKHLELERRMTDSVDLRKDTLDKPFSMSRTVPGDMVAKLRDVEQCRIGDVQRHRGG